MWLLQNGAEVFCNNNSQEWERHYVVHVNNRSGAKILMKILLQQLHHKRLAVFIELFVCSIALVKKCLKDSVILATQEFLIFFTIFTLIGWYWVLVFYRTILTIQSTSFFRDITQIYLSQHTSLLPEQAIKWIPKRFLFVVYKKVIWNTQKLYPEKKRVWYTNIFWYTHFNGLMFSNLTNTFWFLPIIDMNGDSLITNMVEKCVVSKSSNPTFCSKCKMQIAK